MKHTSSSPWERVDTVSELSTFNKILTLYVKENLRNLKMKINYWCCAKFQSFPLWTKDNIRRFNMDLATEFIVGPQLNG